MHGKDTIYFMRKEWLELIKSILLPLAVGGLAAFLTRDAMASFESLEQPPLSPPGWVFGVAWTFLYTLMGISYYLLMQAGGNQEEKKEAGFLYFLQLAVNFLWPIFFFGKGWYLFSLVWLILLWILVFNMIRKFGEISLRAGQLQIPYLVWLTFAAYLNAGVWWLNR